MIELTAATASHCRRRQHPRRRAGSEYEEVFTPWSCQDLYERLGRHDDDDSPWTDEEMELLAWEAGKQAGWEQMDEYDYYPEKP